MKNNSIYTKSKGKKENDLIYNGIVSNNKNGMNEITKLSCTISNNDTYPFNNNDKKKENNEKEDKINHLNNNHNIDNDFSLSNDKETYLGIFPNYFNKFPIISRLYFSQRRHKWILSWKNNININNNNSPSDKSKHDLKKSNKVASKEKNIIKSNNNNNWRMMERMKTTSVGLVLCLNIGTDPPDIEKITPCAHIECWIDPFSMSAQKALETIGKALESQYERWQPRARYRQALDPTVEDIKKLCLSLRKNARNDRVLFHYNGHGVPKPTTNGEIWLFNKTYTQYIPLSIYDLQTWLGLPSVYVFDCTGSGVLLSHFINQNNKNDHELNKLNIDLDNIDKNTNEKRNDKKYGNKSKNDILDPIVLASCSTNDILPMNPEYCADIFTSCLTTPITIALRWFIRKNKLSMSFIDINFIDKIPGTLTDRKTPLGELNWIFTSITDTIAWNVLPPYLFKKLFRQDLLVASLFRNFLLAERILKSNGCNPITIPSLPCTNHHPLWQSWDLAAEGCLYQLYKLMYPSLDIEKTFKYHESLFFSDQLTAFEIWLTFGSSKKSPPQQLPIILQILLSQTHRPRALFLLKKFLDLGSWSIRLALSVGIFPYVLKLLQSPAIELREVLIFIWIKILIFDSSCQIDLIKDSSHLYFIKTFDTLYNIIINIKNNYKNKTNDNIFNYIEEYSVDIINEINNISNNIKLMSLFILSVICENNHYQGQIACCNENIHLIATVLLLYDINYNIRKWSCLLLSKLWENCNETKIIAINENIQTSLSKSLIDVHPEVRSAGIYALKSLIGIHPTYSEYTEEKENNNNNNNSNNVNENSDHTANNTTNEKLKILENDLINNNNNDNKTFMYQGMDIIIGLEILSASYDGSPMVRRESLFGLAQLILNPFHKKKFESVGKYIKNYNKKNINQLNIEDNTNNTISNKEMLKDIKNNIHMNPEGIENISKLIGKDGFNYIFIWNRLKEIQLYEYFPLLSKIAKIIVSTINNNILISNEQLNNDSINDTNNQINKELKKKSEIHIKINNNIITNKIHRDISVPVLKHNHIIYNNNNNNNNNNINLDVVQAFGNHHHSMRNIHSKESTTNTNLIKTKGSVFSSFSNLSSLSITNNMIETVSSTYELFHDISCTIPEKLKSNYYEWSKEYFNENLLEIYKKTDDPLNKIGAERMIRYRRNLKIHKEAIDIYNKYSYDKIIDLNYKKNSKNELSRSFSLSYDISLHENNNKINKISSTIHNNIKKKHIVNNNHLIKPMIHFHQSFLLDNKSQMTSLLLFHPYTNYLIVGDEKNNITLWDYKVNERRYTFSHSNHSINVSNTSLRLDSLGWINDIDESLLYCGTNDGIVKIYHGLHKIMNNNNIDNHNINNIPQLISSFTAIPDMSIEKNHSGMVLTWDQYEGLMFAGGGHSKLIRGWDIEREQCIYNINIIDSNDLNTTNNSNNNNNNNKLSIPIHYLNEINNYTSYPTIEYYYNQLVLTKLNIEENKKNGILISGYNNGNIKLFDRRIHPNYSLINKLQEHTSWINHIHLYKTDKKEFLTADSDGEIKIWDLRFLKMSSKTIKAFKSSMTSVAVHDYAPIIAGGTSNQFIKIFNRDGDKLNMIRYHEGFLGERIGPISCLAFHPHKMILAAGATDSLIGIYSSEK